MREFTEQELVRREKVNALRELGIDPFGHRYDATSDSKEIKEKYSENTKIIIYKIIIYKKFIRLVINCIISYL